MNGKRKLHLPLKYLFVLPAMLLNVVFFIYPFIQTLRISFYDWSILGGKKFIFIKNYVTLVQDKQFWTSLTFTLKYALFVTPCLFILAFILALLVNGTFRGVNIFRTLFFSPVVISMTCCSMIWLWIYNDLYGVMNYLLQMTGLIKEPILWMNSAKTSLPAVIFMVTWKMSGFSMLIILAAFQGVDDQVYEAARVDGANCFQKIRYIVLPSLRSTIVILLLFALGGIVKGNFGLFYNIVGTNPMLYDTTDIIETYVYRSTITDFNFSTASAVGLYQSIIGFCIVMASNFAVKKIDPEYALF